MKVQSFSAASALRLPLNRRVRTDTQRAAEKTVSLLVDSGCPRQLTLFVIIVIDESDLLGFLTIEDMAWRL